MYGISERNYFDQKYSKMIFSEPSPVIANNPASGSQPNFSSTRLCFSFKIMTKGSVKLQHENFDLT